MQDRETVLSWSQSRDGEHAKVGIEGLSICMTRLGMTKQRRGP